LEVAVTGTLDRGPVPKHRQLRAILEQLAGDELRPGDAIPSERELQTRYGVSRATVREAVGALVSDGVLERAHGKGTYVARSRRVEAQLHLASFTRDMQARGLTPTTTVLAAGEVAADPELAARLGVDAGATLVRLERARAADGVPMAIEVGHYVAALLPGFLEHDLSGSVYALLGERYGLAPDEGQQTMGAEAADERLAAQLGIEVGAPLLTYHRTTSASGTRIEDITSWYRADRYQLTVRLTP
jgi:GntR family transcriptional regulator